MAKIWRGGAWLSRFATARWSALSLGESDRAPEITRIKEIASLMDRVPALPPKLIELGHWISRYYVAPIGETFRAMLPPEIELRSDREYSLTDAGRAYLQELSASHELTDEETAELQLLRQFERELPTASARSPRAASPKAKKLAKSSFAAVTQLRAKFCAAAATRTQKIIAWNPANTETDASAARKNNPRSVDGHEWPAAD